MAQEIPRHEEYSAGSGDLIVEVFTGDGHSSEITILRGDFIASGSNNLTENTGSVAHDKLVVNAKISRTGISKYVSLTIKLNDDVNSDQFIYKEHTDENIVRFIVTIDLN